ncbi:MAG: PqqD family protein [Proteobacteria bacterium]|nr:PqqD family protein [Pseudomonadota bacterium]
MHDINLLTVYKTVDNAIVKEIEDELVIITMNENISDIDSSIYTINATGKIVWGKLDGQNSLAKIIEILVCEYDVSKDKVEKDIKELILELLEKGLILEKK